MKRWMPAHCVVDTIMCESELHELIDDLDPETVGELTRLNTLQDLLTTTVETDNIIERLIKKEGTTK